jgi:hypothetical protein
MTLNCVVPEVYDPDGEHTTPEHRQVHLEYRTLVGLTEPKNVYGIFLYYLKVLGKIFSNF